MATPIFITGIGTGVGKTVASAIITEAMEADYWKPVQSGLEEGTDSDWVRAHISNQTTIIHPEVYRLRMPASPHIAARKEGVEVSIKKICEQIPVYNRNLIVEGAGGLMVPLNSGDFIKDLIIALKARVVLVSRNYLGCIHHSLSTAAVCRQNAIPVAGWFFIGYDSTLENEIVAWSGYPRMVSVPEVEHPGKFFIKAMAESHRESIIDMLC